MSWSYNVLNTFNSHWLLWKLRATGILYMTLCSLPDLSLSADQTWTSAFLFQSEHWYSQEIKCLFGLWGLCILVKCCKTLTLTPAFLTLWSRNFPFRWQGLNRTCLCIQETLCKCVTAGTLTLLGTEYMSFLLVCCPCWLGNFKIKSWMNWDLQFIPFWYRV